MQGRIVINHNICDHAPECGGIAVCPTGALYWDDEKEEIGYNRDLCTDCGLCTGDIDPLAGCPVGAIMHAKDEIEYAELLDSVANEKRKLEDLEVERYGAMPIPTDAYLEYSQLEGILNDRSTGTYSLIELFYDDSIRCLLHSIRIENVKKKLEPNAVKYVKVLTDIENDKYTMWGITGISNQEDLPSLTIFDGRRCLGTINGYYEDDREEEFIARIIEIMGK